MKHCILPSGRGGPSSEMFTRDRFFTVSNVWYVGTILDSGEYNFSTIRRGGLCNINTYFGTALIT